MPISCALLAIALTLQADKPFVSVAGGFEVKLPGKPKESVRKDQSIVGEIEYHSFVFEKGPTAYFACYNDFPEEVVPNKGREQMLEGMGKDLFKNSKKTIVREKKIEYGKIPGREFDFAMQLEDAEIATGRLRIFLDQDRLFQVAVVGPGEIVNSAASTAYLDSFKITRKPLTAADKAVRDKLAKAAGPLTFISAEGAFEVKLPKPPLESVQKAGREGKLADIHLYVVPMENISYILSYKDNSGPVLEAEAEAYLTQVTSAVVAGLEGKLLAKKSIRLGGVPGQEVEFSTVSPDGTTDTGRLRIYVNKARVYQVCVVGNTNLATSPAVTDFFDSFKITQPK